MIVMRPAAVITMAEYDLFRDLVSAFNGGVEPGGFDGLAITAGHRQDEAGGVSANDPATLTERRVCHGIADTVAPRTGTLMAPPLWRGT